MLPDLYVPIKNTARKRRPSGKNLYTAVQDSGLSLGYFKRPYVGKHTVNAGRIELWPEIDFADYTFFAVVDWIQIGFDTSEEHQRRKIRNFAKKIVDNGSTVHVGLAGSVPSDGEKRNFKNASIDQGSKKRGRKKGRDFLLTLQDPTPAGFHKLCDALEKRYGIDTSEGQAIRINAIEVSLDIYPKNATDEDRQKMSETLRRHVTVPEFFWDDRLAHPRSVFGWGYEQRAPLRTVAEPKAIHKALAAAATNALQTPAHFRDMDPGAFQQAPIRGTFYFGRRDDVVMIRVQDKVEDRRRKHVAVKLDQDRKRSRIEVTLRSAALRELGVEFEGDVQNLPFDRLVSAVFATSIPTLTSDNGVPDAEECLVFEKGGVLGLDRYQRAKHVEEQLAAGAGRGSRSPKALGKKGHAVAWAEFRKRSRKALLGLEERWRSPGKQNR